MPEGPEIQRACDKIARVLKREKLEKVEVEWPALEEFEQIWQGATIVDLRARGKALLTFFDTGDILYTHNQLYGRWLTRTTHKRPASSRSLRLAFYTRKGSAFLYSATDLEVLSQEEIPQHKYLSSLGPDILDETLRPARIKKRLLEKRFRNRQLAGLYLDQSFLAGPGNYLRSEILFIAGVHPRLKPSQLSEEQLKRLARTTLLVSRRAYETGGVTTEPKLEKRLKAEGERRRTRRHYVFGREGKLCRVCEQEEVEKVTISSRSVFFCPACQLNSPRAE